MNGKLVPRLMVVGLGNYQYPLTRHSIGQVVIEDLVRKCIANRSPSSPHPPSNLLLDRKSRSWHATFRVSIPIPPKKPSKTGANSLQSRPSQPAPTQEADLVLLKPRCFMNESGQAVSLAYRNLFPPDSQPEFGFLPIATIMDDLETESLKVRNARLGGSNKGHNGVKSMKACLGGSGGNKKEFWRIRIGIGRPEENRESGGKGRGVIGVHEWVLGPLGRRELEACEYVERLDSGVYGTVEIGDKGSVLDKCWEEIGRIVGKMVEGPLLQHNVAS